MGDIRPQKEPAGSLWKSGPTGNWLKFSYGVVFDFLIKSYHCDNKIVRAAFDILAVKSHFVVWYKIIQLVLIGQQFLKGLAIDFIRVE